jgi:hypothetical protein
MNASILLNDIDIEVDYPHTYWYVPMGLQSPNTHDESAAATPQHERLRKFPLRELSYGLLHLLR